MPKYIDADALKEAFLFECKDVCDDTDEFDTKWGASQELIEKVIDSAPAADVEPVRRGRWIDHTKPDENNTVYCWCSECGAGDSHHVDIEVPYCWKCGALMKESTRGDLVGDILTKILSDYSAKIEEEKDNAEKL